MGDTITVSLKHLSANFGRWVPLGLITAGLLCYCIWSGHWWTLFWSALVALAISSNIVVACPVEDRQEKTIDVEPPAPDQALQDWVSRDLTNACVRRIDAPIQNLNQVQGLLSGATTQLWSGLRDLSKLSQAQQVQSSALQQLVTAGLVQMRKQAGELNSNVDGMMRDTTSTTQRVLDVGDALDDVLSHLALIEKQLETLSWIADQTNLVAVNAQIEAARLGAQGKGFHVIANEIQQLSKQARFVSEEISTHLMVATLSGDEALSLCSQATRIDIRNLIRSRNQLSKMRAGLDDLLQTSEATSRKVLDNADHLHSRTGDAISHMQFEDIARQVLERSRADLMNLRETLKAPGGESGPQNNSHEAVFSAYERSAMHKPEQENLNAGDIELF